MPSLNKKHFHALTALADEAPLAVRIDGHCMAPLLPDKARVQVRRQRGYWPGDLVVFQQAEGQLTSHRLIGLYLRRGKLRYLTQPDNHPRPDPAIGREQILGRIVGGDCEPEAVHIPLRARIRALGRFGRYLLRRVVGS